MSAPETEKTENNANNDKKNGNTLEQNIRELEKIAKKIDGEISINEIVSIYKTAKQIIKQCKAEIKSIENEIIEINASN